MLQRDVFYIAGYDPKTYRYYYALFKKNLAIYQKHFRLKASLSKSYTGENFPFWEIKGENFYTQYTFLAWNDIVKQNWSKGVKDALKDVCVFVKTFISSGLFKKFFKESIYQVFTGLYPVFYVIFSLILALVLGLAVFEFSKTFLPFFLALVLGFLSSYLTHKILFFYGKKLAVFWIMRICCFCGNWHKNKTELLEQRIESFCTEIFSKLKTHQNKENYELILVAHSVGTILCIELLAKLLKRAQKENLKLDKLKILTLGECIPLTSYQKQAKDFRKKLEFIAGFNLKWYDYTSIIDGACFPQVDFIKTSGISVNPHFGPRFFSAKFHTLYEEKNYKKIKRNKNKAHFLYLMSIEFQGAYDFFRFILGEDFLENKIKKE